MLLALRALWRSKAAFSITGVSRYLELTSRQQRSNVHTEHIGTSYQKDLEQNLRFLAIGSYCQFGLLLAGDE
jgi:hypothetical protein